MVPFLHSGHCNQVFTLEIGWPMSTLNERQLASEVGELSEPILAFTSLKNNDARFSKRSGCQLRHVSVFRVSNLCPRVARSLVKMR